MEKMASRGFCSPFQRFLCNMLKPHVFTGFDSIFDTFVYQDAELLSDVYTLPQFLLYLDGRRVATFSLPQKRPARAVSQAIKAHLFGQHDA